MEFRCLELLLHRIVCIKSGAAIRQALSERMMADFGVSFQSLMEKFTFVFDCGSNMPVIVGASVSESLRPCNDRWVGCISHQINTCVKQVMENIKRNGLLFAITWSALKSLRVFKHISCNDEMCEGKALIQQVEKRFGTTNDVVKRFLSMYNDVVDLHTKGFERSI